MALQNWTHCQIDGGGGGRSQEATNTIVYSRSPLSPPTHTRRGYYAATNTTVYISIYTILCTATTTTSAHRGQNLPKLPKKCEVLRPAVVSTTTRVSALAQPPHI